MIGMTLKELEKTRTMTLKEAVSVLKIERRCVERQTCDRDCANCDLLLPTEDVLNAYSIAIKFIEEFLNCFTEEQADD